MPIILIVDDDPINLKIHCDILQLSGYSVLAVSNGSEALAIAKNHQPDLIFTDVNMPDMNGIEFTQHLKSTAEICHIPVVALTAAAMQGEKEKFLQAGGDGYLTKPFTVDEFLSFVRQYVASSPP